ncbi:MAG TPA: serine hydrolase domain-containing protein [Bryobacteraceae bacterium]|nr:serine hydrolase domain-containing protein [Bryobacteraceae bacterium]
MFLAVSIAWPAAMSDAEARVDELFRPVADGKSPGAVVVAVRDGRVLLMKAYGMADVAKAVPNSPSTIFRLGSITKTFTAIAVLQLVERGKVKLDDPLSKYVTGFAEGIRISQLLGHTAGVPDFMSLDEARKRSLEFEPGTRINYSNNGYHLLSRVVERVSGQPWDEYLRDHVFTPVGMKNTGWDKTEELAGRAMGYLFEKDSYRAAALQDARGAGAAGGLYSTVEDLVRWDKALAAAKLLRKETLELAMTPGVLKDGRRCRYGFGWITGAYRGLREVGHGGDITGFNTWLSRYPDEAFTIIVLSNTGMRPPGPLPAAGDLAHRAAEAWLGDRMKEDVPKYVALDPATLDRYVGRYRLNAPEAVQRAMGGDIVITRSGARLMPEGNGMKLPLDAKSETVFEARASSAELTFVCSGGDCRMILTLAGLREFEALRVRQ